MGQVLATWLVVGVAVFTIGSLFVVFVRLKSTGSAWSLADALSEEVDVATDQKDATGNPIKNNDGNIAKATVMKASSSRLIALLGLIAIMMLYIGVGLALLYSFANNSTVPADTSKITNFLFYGIIMFAPYLVNKFASIFEWMK